MEEDKREKGNIRMRSYYVITIPGTRRNVLKLKVSESFPFVRSATRMGRLAKYYRKRMNEWNDDDLPR